MEVSSALSSYITLQVLLPPVPAFPKPAVHNMYLRRDTPKVPTPDTKRSVFVSNVPIDSSEASLRAFFKQIGGALVERVEFEGDVKLSDVLVKGKKWNEEEGTVTQGKKRKRGQDASDLEEEYKLPSTWELRTRKSGSNAAVVFVDGATVDALLKECKGLAKKSKKTKWTPVEQLGLARYISHHTLTYPPRNELQKKINSYLAHYSTLEDVRSKKLKQLRSEPDADGFVTVTRGGRVGPAKVEEAQAAQERQKERDKNRIGGAFYRFQTREDAKRKERELKEKFEDDARRIREMRQRKGTIRPE